MHVRVWLLAVALPILSLSCTEPCASTADCERGSYCELGSCNVDCTSNLDCGSNNGMAMVCSEVGRCMMPAFNDTDGADDLIGSGPVYIFNELAVSDPGEGFDLDDACSAEGCVDNQLGVLAEFLNDQIRQDLLGGGNLFLVEIAGLDGQPGEVAQDVTLKFYGAVDADEPHFPANNFRTPPGSAKCCEFLVKRRWLTTDNRAVVRIPARVEDGNLKTQVPFPIDIPLFRPITAEDRLYDEDVVVPLEASQVATTLFSNRSLTGRIGGAAPIRRLAEAYNPYCRWESPRCPVALPDASLLDFVSMFASPIPDIDLDGDGLECTVDTDGDAQIDLCCDGAGAASSCAFPPGACVNGSSQVQSLRPGNPEDCAKSQRLADGYSISFDFNAVRATIVGVR